jgi:hypothetical protein
MTNQSFVRNDQGLKLVSGVTTSGVGSLGNGNIVSRAAPNKSGQVRPSSAPAKRPSSPSQGSNSSASTGSGSSALNNSQTRTKYSNDIIFNNSIFRQQC